MRLAVLLAIVLCGCERSVVPPPQPPLASPIAEAAATPVTNSSVPAAAAKWQRELTRQARIEWGMNAPIATFAAQIQQESAWRPDAVSPAGALGMAQFMPATASWISGAYSALAANDPLNPTWAIRALTTYDKILWDAMKAADECNRGAKMLSAYNGGARWVAKDEALAASRGLPADRWWDSVEKVNSGRSAPFWIENRTYPRRILRVLEPRYVQAKWGLGLCQGQ